MSTILTNKIETKSGGLTLDPGEGGLVTVFGELNLTGSTLSYIDENNVTTSLDLSSLASSGGPSITVKDRVNVNKQVLKNDYLQEISNALRDVSFEFNYSGELQGVVDYDSSYIGVRSDIFIDAENISNISNLSVNTKSPKDGFGNVKIAQDPLPYGTIIGESTRKTPGNWSINGNFESYDEFSSPILTYVYNADGTKLYAFVQRPFTDDDYPYALIEFSVNTPYDISTIQPTDVHDENLETSMDTSWGYNGRFAMVNNQQSGFFEIQAVSGFGNIVYQRWTIEESGPGSGIQQRDVFMFNNGEFNEYHNNSHLTFNSDGTKAVILSFSDDPFDDFEVISFDVSPPFSGNSSDYNESGRQLFNAVHSEYAYPHPALKLKEDGSGLLVYMIVDFVGFYAFEVSLTNFVADSNISVVNQSFKESKDLYYNYIDQSIGYDGIFFVSGKNYNRDRNLDDPLDQLIVAGLGDIKSPASFERSIDLTNDLDSPPTSVVLTQQDTSDDANVTISVNISDGTNTVAITQLDTEIDCSTLTSRTLTATWNLSVSDVQGTNAKIENYALNFK